jgi:hypothetical protein
LTNATIVSASVISAVLIVSSVLKACGFKQAVRWARDKLPWLSSQTLVGAVALWIVLELYLSIWLLMNAERYSVLPLALGACLLSVSILIRILHKKLGNCPCFGDASNIDKDISLKVCAAALAVVVLTYIAASFLSLDLAFLLVLSSVLAGSFLLGYSLVLRALRGAVCNYSELEHFKRGLDGCEEVDVLLVCFVKPGCHACMVFMRYVQMISSIAFGNIKFVVIMEGLSIANPSKLGNAFVHCDLSNELKSSAKIKATPALVSIQHGEQRKYVGLDACSSAVASVVCTLLSK